MSLFHEGGRGQEKTTLSLLKNVTISLGGVGVKVNLDNVTNFTGFFFKASLSKMFNFFICIFLGISKLLPT